MGSGRKQPFHRRLQRLFYLKHTFSIRGKIHVVIYSRVSSLSPNSVVASIQGLWSWRSSASRPLAHLDRLIDNAKHKGRSKSGGNCNGDISGIMVSLFSQFYQSYVGEQPQREARRGRCAQHQPEITRAPRLQQSIDRQDQPEIFPAADFTLFRAYQASRVAVLHQRSLGCRWGRSARLAGQR